MFASHIKKTIQFTEGTATISAVIRKLSAKSLEDAADIRQGAVIKYMRDTGKDILDAMKAPVTDAQVKEKPKKFDELNDAERKTAFYATYDRRAVLRAGTESWEADSKDFKLPAIETGIDDLDEETAEILFLEIMNLSRPRAAVLESEKSKDSGLSIVS